MKLDFSLSETKDGLYAYSLKVRARSSDDSNDSNDSNNSNDSDGLGVNIFVFRRSTPTMNPYGRTDALVDDEFFNVATPVDMYDIPAKAPDIEHNMPYFRDSSVELWFRNLEDALRAKREIAGDVASLTRLWDNLNSPDRFKFHETMEFDSGPQE